MWTEYESEGTRYWVFTSEVSTIPPAAIRQSGPRWYLWTAIKGGRSHERSLLAAKQAAEQWIQEHA